MEFFVLERNRCLQLEKQTSEPAIALDPAVERSVLVGEVQLCMHLVFIVRFMINFGHCYTSVTMKALSPVTFSLSCVAAVVI